MMRELRMGRSLALVSDAGMPAISDPGAALVRSGNELLRGRAQLRYIRHCKRARWQRWAMVST